MIDTILTMVMDASASMMSVSTETIDGYNGFIKEQRKLSDECWLNTVMFGSGVHLWREKENLHQCDLMDHYPCLGGTALLDAVGQAIVWTEEQTKSPDAEMAQVYVVIMTDGAENASDNYTLAQIKLMVETKRKVEGWNFIFLGANQQAEKTARDMGIVEQAALTYSGGKKGTKAALLEAARSVRESRENDSPAMISDEAKKEQRLLLECKD